MDYTSELIVTLTGFALSLFFAYFPGVKNWFDELPSEQKPLLNLGVLFAVAVGAYLYKCRLEPVCLQTNLEMAIIAFIGAMVTNQTTYQIGVKQQKRAERRAQMDAE